MDDDDYSAIEVILEELPPDSFIVARLPFTININSRGLYLIAHSFNFFAESLPEGKKKDFLKEAAKDFTKAYQLDEEDLLNYAPAYSLYAWSSLIEEDEPKNPYNDPDCDR